MPDRRPEQKSTPPTRVDKLTTTLMVVAALCAMTGFGILFSIWWQSGITDKYEILRIASQEFVRGHPIIAGDLAETVDFSEQSDDPLPTARSSADPTTPEDPSEADKKLSAAEIAEPQQVRKAKEKLQDWIRLRDFLVGAGKVARANHETDSRDRRRFLREALPHLEAAAKSGFPPGRQTEGNRIMGESMFELGRYDEAIPALQAAINRDPTLQRVLAPRLAEAELRSAGSTADRALETIEKFLRDDSLQPEQRWAGEQTRVRALIGTKRWDDATAAIAAARQQARSANIEEPTIKDALRKFSDELSLLEAIVKIQRAKERYGPIDDENPLTSRTQNRDLEETLRELMNLQREAMPPVSTQARLWAARANLIAGRRDDALALLTAVRQQRPLGPDGIIGGLEEIELLAKQGRGEEVLQTTRYLMRELGDPQGFQASEISFKDFRLRMIQALDQLRQLGDYEHAIDASRALPPVFEASEALIQEGIGYQQWAAATKTDDQNLSHQAARGAARLARTRYRAAGDAFAQAAKELFDTEEYLPVQWSAIQAYQDGRHFSRSIALLEPYLRYEHRRRQPRGLVAYGRALLAEGDADEAIEALTTCISEFKRDPLRYDARLLAALAHAEMGNLDTARQLLTENLQDGNLTPQSPAWRDSLFTLAELLYQRGYRTYLLAEQSSASERLKLLRENQPTLDEAVQYLDQAVERYKWIPRTESAAYMSAHAHVLASRWPRMESESPEILDTARRSLRSRADAQLQVALDGFIRLRQHLLSREDERGLPEREQRLLRNCYVAEADVLRQMNRLEEAANAYQVIELRYMNEPTALEAILGRAACMRELGRDGEADMLIRQANVVLGRIPREWDAKFAEITRYDRDGWRALLGWMNDRIKDDA